MIRALILAAVVCAPALARADDGPPGAPPAAAPDPAAASVADDGPCGGHHWWADPGRQPRFAIGFARGHLELDGDRSGSQSALLARARLHHGLELELELARGEIEGDEVHTAGGALLKTFGHHRVAPYVIAGGGGGRIERADGREPHLGYGELGGGVMVRGRHLAIGFDVRAGVRRVDDGDAAPAPSPSTRLAAPAPAPVTDDDDHEHYVRCRIIAMLYF